VEEEEVKADLEMKNLQFHHGVDDAQDMDIESRGDFRPKLPLLRKDLGIPTTTQPALFRSVVINWLLLSDSKQKKLMAKKIWRNVCFHFWFENPGLLTNNHFAHTSAMRYIHKWCLEKYGISFDKMTIWTDGCPTTYKNQFAVAGLEWLRRNCVMSSVTNNFTGTGCFVGEFSRRVKLLQ